MGTSLSQAAKAWKKYDWLGPSAWPWDDSGQGPWLTASQDHIPPGPSLHMEATCVENQVLVGRKNRYWEAQSNITHPGALSSCSDGSCAPLVAALTTLCWSALFIGSLPHWTVSGLKSQRLFCLSFLPQHLQLRLAHGSCPTGSAWMDK